MWLFANRHTLPCLFLSDGLCRLFRQRPHFAACFRHGKIAAASVVPVGQDAAWDFPPVKCMVVDGGAVGMAVDDGGGLRMAC